MTISVPTSGYIGLVVRGKTSRGHHPGVMEQHADCILSTGAPVGFYGTGRGTSGSGSTGMGMSGIVYDFSMLLRYRPYYIDIVEAKKYSMKSTIAMVQVVPAEARAFDAAWATMSGSPGGFAILGNNCSTHASKAFVAAGILPGGIPGLDTPDNLFEQLVTSTRKTLVYSGYVGFVPRGAGYDVQVDP
ncbi:MAG: hypothetical protein JSS05_10140 [Proteobacteria bacterium]|nr:hypothetical protein [Pseudomonadota bacterium]